MSLLMCAQLMALVVAVTWQFCPLPDSDRSDPATETMCICHPRLGRRCLEPEDRDFCLAVITSKTFP